MKIFQKNEYIASSELIRLKTLKNEFIKYNLEYVDILKIDTEGYEFEVLIGAKDVLSEISIVLFEHHYDDMIAKNYKFSDIHNFLLTNHFIQLYKSKMPFRKTFEYIYINKSKNNLITRSI